MFARPLAILALTLAGTAALGTLGAAGGGCHPLTAATAGTGVAVDIRNCGFGPTILRAPVGATVTFTNADQVPHVVSGVGWGSQSYDTGMLTVGQSRSERFTAAGIYPYMCFLHPGMSGAIVVGDATTVGAPVSAPQAIASVTPSPTPAAVLAPPPAPRSSAPFPELALGLGVAAAAGGAGYALARRRV